MEKALSLKREKTQKEGEEARVQKERNPAHAHPTPIVQFEVRRAEDHQWFRGDLQYHTFRAGQTQTSGIQVQC